MNAIAISFLAAGSAALSNLFFRKNSSAVGCTAHGYLVFFYLISLFLSFVIFPSILNEPLNLTMLGIGMSVGMLNVALMHLTFQAVQKGPAGLTYAFQNTSAVFPGMILFLLFGTEYGFSYSFLKIIGILLVVVGLFLGAKEASSGNRQAIPSSWIKYAVACLSVQILALTLIQGRCIVCESQQVLESSPVALTSHGDICFMIGQFGAAFFIQTIYFLSQKNSRFRIDAFYGTLGGIANFFSTFLLLLATKWALSFEKALLFPCFAVGTIILCNLWAKRLYNEKFHLASNVICASGILLGLTTD